MDKEKTGKKLSFRKILSFVALALFVVVGVYRLLNTNENSYVNEHMSVVEADDKAQQESVSSVQVVPLPTVEVVEAVSESDATNSTAETVPGTDVLTSVVEAVSETISVCQGEVAEKPATKPSTQSSAQTQKTVSESGEYWKKDDVALYIHLYSHLPSNYITKKEAQALGWSGGSLEPYAKGKSIGGDRFGNMEQLLPTKSGRKYTECDIDTRGKSSRGAKRIVFSNDGLVYYTGDHYESFELLYSSQSSMSMDFSTW